MKRSSSTKEIFLENLGQFHSWDNEKTWNAGGFNTIQLSYFIRLAESISNCEIIETGAGNSTIAFLLVNPRKVTSIAPDFELWARIDDYCTSHQISTNKLHTIKDKSESALPGLAQEKCNYDLALIDGCHGWPTVFIDLHYINCMLRKNGYLIIDDIHLHSVKELVNFLVAEVDKFELVVSLGKTLVFRKLTDEVELGDWNQQRYIVEKTNESRNLGNKFALYDMSKKDYNTLGYGYELSKQGLIFIIRICAWLLVRIQGKFKG